MAEYVDKKHIYDLFEGTNGVIRLHVAEVDTLPAADVAPVVHGKWKVTIPAWGSKAGIQCSNCWRNDTIDEERRYFIRVLPNYCSKCGARMDGEG